jgi:hypothetical protein
VRRATRLKPQRPLADVAEDWTGVGHFDVSADQRDAGNKPTPEHVVNNHDGSVPAGKLKNEAERRGGPE